jgi:DoxX-like protein
MSFLLPPWWLIHVAVAAVWLYEGIWCKLLGGEPNQARVVGAVPQLGPRFGAPFLKILGIVEVVLALWVLSRLAPVVCAFAQTVLLVALNTGGLLFARELIHDPPGMLVKNFAFLILVWVSASSAAWQ